MSKALDLLKTAVDVPENDTAIAVPAIAFGSKEDKWAALKSVEKALTKQFKVESCLVRMGDRLNFQVPSVSTGLPSLDNEVLGCGGIPIGRIIEIFGPESAGKTTLACHIIAQEQRNTDNICALIDAEHAIDVQYAAALGVNVDELLISQPNSGEDALETVEALVDSRAVSLIVIDSVAALVPQAELDGEMSDSNMGLHARLMSRAMRKLRGKANTNGVTLIFLNQIRDKIGVMFGSPETTTGGRALKFFASVRLDVRRISAGIKSGDVLIGHQIKIKAVKNKVGVPFKETVIDLLYASGIDTFSDLIAYSVRVGAIQQKGAWYSFKGERLANGLQNLIDRVRLDSKLYEDIKLEVAKAQAAQREAGKQ